MELKNVEIIEIGTLKEFDSGFRCVDFVVRTSEEYAQTLILQANKVNADNIIKYNKVGDKVDVSLNLKGREWINKDGEKKYFNTLEAWKVFKTEKQEFKSMQEAAEVINEIIAPAEDNSLPF